MLIFEGSDCLGKTTAISKVRAQLKDWNPPVMYCHMGRPNEKKFDFRCGYLDHMRRNVVQDRFHLGGIVWHENKVTRDSLFFVERHLAEVGAVISVFVATDKEWYRKQLDKDPRGNLFNTETMMAANQQYIDMVDEKHPLHPKVDFFFDVSGNAWPTEDQIAEVITEWKRRQTCE